MSDTIPNRSHDHLRLLLQDFDRRASRRHISLSDDDAQSPWIDHAVGGLESCIVRGVYTEISVKIQV